MALADDARHPDCNPAQLWAGLHFHSFSTSKRRDRTDTPRQVVGGKFLDLVRSGVERRSKEFLVGQNITGRVGIGRVGDQLETTG